MKHTRKTLAVVSNKKEVQEVLRHSKNDIVFISTNLATEFYLEKIIEKYKNPLYDLIFKSKFTKSKNYVFNNFKIAYEFCNDKHLQYFRDRLGYFLAELERSLDLAKWAIKKYHPHLLIIGNLNNYPGSSVVDGTLKTNAFSLIAKEKKIPYSLIGANEKSFSFKQSVGKKIRLFRYLNKQGIQSECDLLILATPRHLIQMVSIINEIKSRGVNLTILTYNVTLALKAELDKNFAVYLEKERLIDSKIRKDVRKAHERLRRDKPWNKFTAKKYKKKSVALNYIKWKIQDIVKNETSEIFTDILLAEKILLLLNPKALLVTTDPDTKVLPYINRAKEEEIKTICVQHGAFTGSDSPAVYPASEYFIAWSDLSRKFLKKVPYFKKVQILVGTSPFHKLKNLPEKLQKSKNLSILYLCTKQPAVEKGLIMFYQKELFDILSKIDIDFRLLVRVHPYQDMSNLESLIKNFNHHPASFANNLSLEEVIRHSDLVIYENTTAGFDAMLAGKSTIYFNPYTGEDYFNVGLSKASLLILNDLELNKKLPEIIYDRKSWARIANNGQKFALRYLGIGDSKEYEKLTDVILNIIKSP